MTAPAAPLDRAVETLRDDLKYVNASWVEVAAGSDAADVIRSAEALLAALDADKRLEEAEARLARIECYAGERCEASGCRFDPCGPVEYHDVEGVPLCAECWQECVDEAEDARREEKEVPE